MGKAAVMVKDFCGVFLNPKSVLALILSAAIVCVLSCIVGTGYAKSVAGQSEYTRTANNLVNNSDEWQTVPMRVTAYCPCRKCCGRYSDGETASGHKILPHDCFVAADREYPFGTEMVIPGYGNGKPVKVLDRGGAISENRLDVFFASHKQALQWGVKYLHVKVRHK